MLVTVAPGGDLLDRADCEHCDPRVPHASSDADSVIYREALAVEAEAHGWSVYWYERERVFRDAAAVLGCGDINAFLNVMGRSIGPPWQAKHKLAAAAALAAARRPAP